MKTRAERAEAELARTKPALDRLVMLLSVPAGSRFSELDRLRRAPTRASGRERVHALDRASEIAALGAGDIVVDEVPPGRLEALARQGSTGDVPALCRLPSLAGRRRCWPRPGRCRWRG